MWSLFLPFLTVFLLIFIYLQYFSAYFKKENELEGDEVYIDKFPVNMSFEITPYNKWTKFNFLGSFDKRQILDDYEFDLNVYISSDYRCVAKAIKKSDEIKDIICDIIKNKIIKAIEFSHNKIKILFKDEYITPTNRELTTDHAKFLYDKRIKILQQKFIPLLKESYNNELTEDIEFAKQKNKNINHLKNFYSSFFVSFFTQVIYNFHIKPYYWIINQISIIFVSLITLLIFISFSFVIWKKMVGSARIHKLFLPHLMFLGSLPFFIYSFIYTANYTLDNSQPEVFITMHTLDTSKEARFTSYYYTPHDLGYIRLKSDFRISIGYTYYSRLLKSEKSEVTVKKGWLGYPYITNVKAIKEEQK